MDFIIDNLLHLADKHNKQLEHVSNLSYLQGRGAYGDYKKHYSFNFTSIITDGKGKEYKFNTNLHPTKSDEKDSYRSSYDHKDNSRIDYYAYNNRYAIAIAYSADSELIEIESSINDCNNNTYTVNLVYIAGETFNLHLPNTIEDVFVDSYFTERYKCYSSIRRDQDHYISIDPENKYLVMHNNGLYSKGMKSLIYQNPTFDGRGSMKAIDLDLSSIRELESIRPGALSRCKINTLTLPESINSFNTGRIFGIHSDFSVNTIVFNGQLKELYISNLEHHANCKFRINNQMENVDIYNPDGTRLTNTPSDKYIFASPINHECNNGIVEFTLAGTRVINPPISSIHNFQSNQWQSKCKVNIDYVAAVIPTKLDCFEEKDGSILLLLGPWTRDIYDQIEKWPVLVVYEDYEYVTKVLEASGWGKKRLQTI